MERLTPSDLMMLRSDEFGWPQDIGALAVLDGARLLDEDGRVRIEKVRRAVEARLPLIPRFRQLLRVPRRGLGAPFWVDDARFDLTDHVSVSPHAAAGEAELLHLVEVLRRRPLDRSRPLWEMWLVPGLPERRVGLFVRMHHAIADGAAGVAIIGQLLDPDPDTDPDTGADLDPADTWRPAPPPTPRELLTDNARDRLRKLRHAVAALGHTRTSLRRLRRAWPAMRGVLAVPPAARTSFNQPIGADRTFTVIRTELGVVKDIAHACGATVNDVVLTAAAGGLRALLQRRGEPVDGAVLRAVVPISLHRRQPGTARGNLDGTMFVPLPVGQPDPQERLRRIAANTARQRKLYHPAGGSVFRSAMVQRAGLRLLARQRWVNTYVANVPGPHEPRYLAGARMLEVFPVVPLTGNITIGIGALSYADRFTITVVADPHACPDAEIFTEGVEHTLRAMSASCPRMSQTHA